MASDSISLSAVHPDARRFYELKARVEALGHKLVISNEIDANDKKYTGLYILNPETDELVIVTAGSEAEDLNEVEGWCNSAMATPAVAATAADHFAFTQIGHGEMRMGREKASAKELAARHIRDALRWSELCHGALGSETCYGEVRETIGRELQGALHDALAAVEGGAL